DFLVKDTVIFLPELPFIDNLVLKKSGIACIKNFNFLHHLTYNHFNVLIIDFHPLKSVYFLDLIDQVVLNSRWSLDGKNVIWRNGSIRKWLTCSNKVIFLNKDVFGKRHH